MNFKPNEAYTFNDVLIVPNFSSVKSRKNIDISTNLTKNIKLKIPIISSNMDTVTGYEMAIEMAKNGGLGILHRFLSIEDQVDMVKKVKRYMNYKIDDPYTMNINTTVEDYKYKCLTTKVKSFPVVDDNKNLLGMITNRDILFSSDNNNLIKDLMTPINNLVYASKDISLDKAYDVMKTHKIEKLPLIENHNNNLSGLITIKDILNYKKTNLVSTIDKRGQLMVGAAIGVKENDIIRAEKLIEAGVDIICVDVAHGHNTLSFNTIKTIRQKWPNIDIIGGNVATASGVKHLVDAGANCVKIGIGNGSICITRMITGVGIPQLTALYDCIKEANKLGVTVISDGGNGGQIGNIAKALGIGSNVVMLGNFLAGTDESPGKILVKDGKRVKLVRGMSGYGANLSRKEKIEKTDDISDIVPEGVDAYIPYKGKVKDILYQICGGVRSSMSYCGSYTLENFVNNIEFVRITDAGRKNSNYHSVNLL